MESVMKMSELKLAHTPLVDCVQQKRLNDTRDRSIPWENGAVSQRKGDPKAFVPFPAITSIIRLCSMSDRKNTKFSICLRSPTAECLEATPTGAPVNALLIRGLLNLYQF
jgi:hypothetical protein